MQSGYLVQSKTKEPLLTLFTHNTTVDMSLVKSYLLVLQVAREISSQLKDFVVQEFKDGFSVVMAEEFNAKVGGSSAGHMNMLSILCQMFGYEVARNHMITGTGSIEQNGNIGRIGGIGEKLKFVQTESTNSNTIYIALYPEAHSQEVGNLNLESTKHFKVHPVKHILDSFILLIQNKYIVKDQQDEGLEDALIQQLNGIKNTLELRDLVQLFAKLASSLATTPSAGQLDPTMRPSADLPPDSDRDMPPSTPAP